MPKIFTGIVTSNKMTKTVTVMIERKLRHPVYGKVIKLHKKLKAHNEDLPIEIGDTVEIKETRPISKDKFFIVTKKIK